MSRTIMYRRSSCSGSPITYAPAMRLDANRGIAMQMMSDIEKIYELLPEIDCGSCGATLR